MSLRNSYQQHTNKTEQTTLLIVAVVFVGWKLGGLLRKTHVHVWGWQKHTMETFGNISETKHKQQLKPEIRELHVNKSGCQAKQKE